MPVKGLYTVLDRYYNEEGVSFSQTSLNGQLVSRAHGQRYVDVLASSGTVDMYLTSGLRVMNKRLQDCDCVLEIHDARVSFHLFTVIST